jgi:hypothetical protein
MLDQVDEECAYARHPADEEAKLEPLDGWQLPDCDAETATHPHHWLGDGASPPLFTFH